MRPGHSEQHTCRQPSTQSLATAMAGVSLSALSLQKSAVMMFGPPRHALTCEVYLQVFFFACRHRLSLPQGWSLTAPPHHRFLSSTYVPTSASFGGHLHGWLGVPPSGSILCELGLTMPPYLLWPCTCFFLGRSPPISSHLISSLDPLLGHGLR